jgi:hypothetical protein
MTVNSGTRWLPEPEPSAQDRGGGAAQRRKLAISSQSFGGQSKWCASVLEESSRQSIKVVEELGRLLGNGGLLFAE